MGKGSSESSSSSEQKDYRTGGDNGAITAGVDSTQTITYNVIDDGLVDFGRDALEGTFSIVSDVIAAADNALQSNYEQSSKLVDLSNSNTQATIAALDDDKSSDIGLTLAKSATPVALMLGVSYLALKSGVFK